MCESGERRREDATSDRHDKYPAVHHSADLRRHVAPILPEREYKCKLAPPVQNGG